MINQTNSNMLYMFRNCIEADLLPAGPITPFIIDDILKLLSLKFESEIHEMGKKAGINNLINPKKAMEYCAMTVVFLRYTITPNTTRRKTVF